MEVVRLRTLPAAVAPVILGAGAASALGAVSGPRVLLAAGVALALQIGSNLANDYSDGVRGTDDERTGPPRLTASGRVDPRRVKYAAFGCFGLAGVLGLVLVALAGQWWLLGAGAAAVAAAWFYTGGSHPYGYAGLGEVFVFIFFGLMATCGTVYVQAGGVPGWLWPAACGIGLIACSLLMVNNLRDITTDPRHGKMTLAVRLGDRRARGAFVVMVTVPVVLAVVAVVWARADLMVRAPGGSSWAWPGVIALLVGVLAVMAARTLRPVLSGATGRALIPALRDAGLYELAYGGALALALIAAA
ncbi:1,4-dihydroxy-2-naphthoate polyprenyltransferase [Actinomyces qiguomingii]|uniref:1,4-dihydroxy-2-naphthoate polyprenyltransferase n=1 Tax=Actinomyces qiguomingii TaxID=2057800 RepID=UPI001E4C8948|nr:1,4-dihydroxy-2-naphthoate polyprenyltransferase [Actinomyces qiguomingii]